MSSIILFVYPLSFEEFYSYRGGITSEALDEYMLYGGMPGLINEPTDERKRMYLKNLYDEIYLKDLVEHAKVQRQDVLEEVLDYLASSIGSLTNANRITGAINTKASSKISDDTVSKYLKHSIDAFLISEARRYDIKGKRYFDYPNKYYFSDIGLRNARLNYRKIDPGHIMENIIYNELIRYGYSVDVGVVEERSIENKKLKEIDFVVNSFDKKIYIQSALRIDEQRKKDVEVESLKLTGDFFKKIIIRNDIPASYYDNVGIFHCKLLDFLLKKVDIF